MKKSGGKHIKYSPFSPSDGNKDTLLPGRHICLCEATKHQLINNCIHCGRIVCLQEGSGPCFTCGNLVCTPEEQEVINKQSKSSFKLFQKLMDGGSNELNKIAGINDSHLKMALEHRDKLLEFDRTTERRAKVIDDENDYFQTGSDKWLSAKERKLLKEKEQEFRETLLGRKNQKFTLDFAGRKVVEEKPRLILDPDELLKSDTSIFECKDSSNVNLPSDYVPEYLETSECTIPNESINMEDRFSKIRIQDRELQEMSDEGLCLSLHQPHASLLVAGIKKHEGRTWYTSYRGRLWIHAAGKKPTKQDIIEAENAYHAIVGDCTFPESYPSGCLLGCVDVLDCLSQEEYSEQFPLGESASPYVLICDNAQELLIKFPMKGKNKIFKLDGNIHQAAKKTLRKQS